MYFNKENIVFLVIIQQSGGQGDFTFKFLHDTSVPFSFFSVSLTLVFCLTHRAYFKSFIPQFQEGAFANGKL